MTRLKELRLHGFKTFADPTRFVFERGVTAVIGPNGSGKSNMADAVRWVLGEQSNRSLRTRRADDVIFAGSEGRRPQGMAEAILTLDNSDGWLPIDFSEVSIGRRAYRSGETEYLINGARARLREVVDLLAGGRLGANELVVVGQGTVDAALSLRPEERRQLFEEAAGVKNLQVRKNEALGRLARARDNLTRVGDLIGELKPQVRRLALQAQHQQEHDVLGQRARTLVIEVHRRRELIARTALGEARRRKAAAEAAVEALRAEEAAGREAIGTAEAAYWSAESSARAASEGREAAREALIRAEAHAEAIARRLADLSSVIARSQAELDATQAALQAEPAAADPNADATWEAAREAERRWRAAGEGFDAADRDALSAEEAVSAARARAGASIAEAARRDEAVARAAAKAERIEEELRAARVASSTAGTALEAAETELTEAEAAEAEAIGRLQVADREGDEAQLRADEARAGATALAERVGSLRAELESLRERAESGSRLGSRLANAGWRTLMNAIDPPREAWAAIEALVGGEVQQALVWQDDGVAEHAADARGSARLLAESNDALEGRPAALAAVGATMTVAEWIGAASSPRLFARAVVAPDLPTLLGGWRRLPPGWCAVTAEGDLADERGLVIVRGRQDEAAGEAARQHERRRELAQLVESLELEQSRAGEAAGLALVASSQAHRARDEARALRSEAEQRTSQARAAHARAVEVSDHARYGERALAAELDASGNDAVAGSSGAPPSAADTYVATLAAAAIAARERRAELAVTRDQLRAAWQTAQSAVDATDSARSRGGYEQALLEARSDQLRATLAGDRESLAALDRDRNAAGEASAAAAAGVALATNERDLADAERDRLRADLLERERTRGGAASRMAELERGSQAAALVAQRHEDELVAIVRERDLAIESLPPTVDDVDAGADGAIADADLGDAPLEAIAEELTRVRRTLSQIGSVNPFAIDEHRELAGRLETLVAQDADLSAASASTEELIGRLEADIAQQFNAAFVAIGAKFDEFCRLLFAGGSASLQMSDADGEAGGIEIAVQPPGKRLQRLPMLSGGERALTGVALLFAMLSVNPVPFCILDEVDAALDEANIGRFADALRLLAQTIDFVVITHNRATIETADTIYGVTMTDAAVSRLLSLRLADVPVEVAVG
ncbi:MAG: chromosome segregation protein SMC [Chloroflexota bacterium]